MCEPQCQTFVSSIQKHFQASARCKEQMQQICALNVRMCSQWSHCKNGPSHAQLSGILRRASDGQAQIVKAFESKHLPDIYIDIETLKKQTHTATPRTSARALIATNLCSQWSHCNNGRLKTSSCQTFTQTLELWTSNTNSHTSNKCTCTHSHVWER